MTTSFVGGEVGSDFPERIRAGLGRRLGRVLPARVVDVLAREIAVLYFAAASWGRRAYVPVGATAYGYHRRSGRVGILYTIAGLVVIETLVVDLVVRRHHPALANSLLAVSIASAIWLIGFARSVQLRPILVDAHTLALRMGVQWTIDVPRSNIESIEFGRTHTSADKTTPAYLQLVTRPDVVITLRDAQRVSGSRGDSRLVKQIAFTIDDAKKFQAQINNSVTVALPLSSG